MAENLAKKKIHGGRRASATQMVNTVGKMITAFDAASTLELDIRPLQVVFLFLVRDQAGGR